MSIESSAISILFADVCHSTRLYEQRGDSEALGLIADCLQVLAEQAQRHSGSVVKTIGDEIMCTFGSADDAVMAAVAMQTAVTGELRSRNPLTPPDFQIRVGLHHGEALVEGTDVFGDAVNLAARMAHLARGSQIVTCSETVEQLMPALRAGMRRIDRTAVRGKSEEIDIYEVVWQPEKATVVGTLSPLGSDRSESLVLTYGGRETRFQQHGRPLVLGRGTLADITVDDAMVSREHARIEGRRGKFYLVDQSTNGSYVSSGSAAAVTYLKHEELALPASGRISLGREFTDGEAVIFFEVNPSGSARPD